LNNISTPEHVMKAIRTAVRSEFKSTAHRAPSISSDEEFKSENSELVKEIEQRLKRMEQRIPAGIPVAFIEPQLISRYKILGKFLVPIRKFGTRLFTKWYVDVFSSQQKYLNSEIWFALSNMLDVVHKQNKVILQLESKNDELYARLEQNEKLISDLAEKFETIKKNKKLNFDYSKFASKFAADSQAVKSIYSQYIQYFEGVEQVIDLGCGKGYFLELLRENGINGLGIDSDQKLIDECINKGFEARVDDVNSFLFNAEDSSIPAIFMGHVIEHLDVEDKINFIALCYRKLQFNGILILETPNTTSTFVMHNLYYLDPTHQKPMLPEALKYICELAGFNVTNSYLSGEIKDGADNDGHPYYNFSLILKKA